jgi:hypothetical protein
VVHLPKLARLREGVGFVDKKDPSRTRGPRSFPRARRGNYVIEARGDQTRHFAD